MKAKVGIGIDLGGTAIKYGLVDENGNILWRAEKPTKANISRESIVENISEAAFQVIEKSKELGLEVVSIGIGTPGLVKDKNVVIGGADNLADWENIPLGELIATQVKLPTFVANDGDLMAIAEFSKHGAVNDTFLFFTLGTGIGGAMFINGELFQGHFGLGGELGVFPMIVNNEVLNWEDVASTAAMVKSYKEKCLDNIKERIDGKYITKKYFEGEHLAQDVISEMTDYVAMGVAGYINALNPKKIIIGGGITTSGPFFIDIVREKVSKYALKACYENVEIEAAKLANDAGLVGAGIYGLKHGSIQNKVSETSIK